MKLQRILAGFIVLLLILFIPTGCDLVDQKGDEEEDPYRHIYFYYPHDGNQILKRLILEYNDAQEQLYMQLQTQSPGKDEIPKQLRIEGLEGPGNRDTFFEKLDELMAAGETVPDMIMVNDTWLMELIADDLILPLDGGLPESKKNMFFDGMNQAVTYNNNSYGVPFWQDIPLLYYRKDLMEIPPSSWKDLAKVANEISQAREIKYGLVFPGAAQDNSALFLSSIWSYYGVQLGIEDGEINFNEESMSLSLNLLRSMAANETLSSDVLSMSAEDCRGAFESGDAVFMWNWSYASRLFNNEEVPSIAGKIGISSLPLSEDGGGLISGYVLTMCKSSNQISETWDFIQFLVSEESQIQLRDSGLLPARKSLYETSWLEQTGLPLDLVAMLDLGRPLKLESHSDAVVTIMNQSVSMAVNHNMTTDSMIQYIKSGILTEESNNTTEPGSIEEPGSAEELDDTAESENDGEDSEGEN